MLYADLHVHSTHSDGRFTPRRIVEEAVKAGVGLLAVADHDMFSGSLEAEPIALDASVSFIRACELTTQHEGRIYHVLAYGADFEKEALKRLIRGARRALDQMSVDLIDRMQADYPDLSPEDFERFERDPSMGGWKGLEYLYRRGLSQNYKDGIAYYARYGVTYEQAGFPALTQAAAQIRAAGGRAVLAHPGESVGAQESAAFSAALNALIDAGLDGLECYYPTHPDWVTRACLELCARRNLIVTSGSDCHGGFSGSDIGCLKTPAGALRLDGIAIARPQ